jgi:hypothetical protein
VSSNLTPSAKLLVWCLLTAKTPSKRSEKSTCLASAHVGVCRMMPTSASAKADIPYAGTRCESRVGARTAQLYERPVLEFELAFENLRVKRDWASEIALKRTPEAVLEVVREYARLHGPTVWAALLPDQPPPPFATSEEVSSYAVALMQREFKLAGEAAVRHCEFVSFFAAAAQRLAQLTAPHVMAHPFFSRDAYLASTPEQ